MARKPATPEADDPGSERITMTRAELDEHIAVALERRAALAAAVVADPPPVLEVLPTLAEAKEARTSSAGPILSREGWLV